MIPGMREIYSTLPKVRLTLKMKKSPAMQWGWFVREDYFENLTAIRNSGEETKDILSAFGLFLKDYNEPELRAGIALAGEVYNRIKYQREASRTGVNVKDRDAKDKFEAKVGARMYDVYAAREIPVFNRKTKGTIIYEPRIITEKRMDEFKEECRLSEYIKVFKFKDKHGRVSINFYAPSKFPAKQSYGGRQGWR